MEPSHIYSKAHLNVSNETNSSIQAVVEWQSCNAGSQVLQRGVQPLQIPAFSSVWLDKLDFPEMDFLENHLFYTLRVDEEALSSGSVIFTAPKHHRFRDPHLKLTAQDDTITVSAATYAKCVEIHNSSGNFVLNDNYFDMEKGLAVRKVLAGNTEGLQVRSVYDIR